jgi:hypothetical protein
MRRSRLLAGLALSALLTAGSTAAHASSGRGETSYKLWQIVIGMEAHRDVVGQLPGDIVDGQGRPLLSWRVRLLPFIEHGNLCSQFHLDEPWDSPHNRTLIRPIPKPYYSPMGDIPDGQTTFLRPRGPGTVFAPEMPGGARPVRGDPAWTIVLVQADEEHAVIWTKPEDLPYDPEQPGRGLARRWQIGFFKECGTAAGFADGSARLIPSSAEAEELRPLFHADAAALPGRPWEELLSRRHYLSFIAPVLLIAVVCIAAAVPVGWRACRGKPTSPGEFFLLIVGVDQLAFLLCFVFLYRANPIASVYGSHPRAASLCYLPYLAGALAAISPFLAFKTPVWRAWASVNLALWVLAALGSVWSDWPRYAEEALLTSAPPLVLACVGPALAVLTFVRSGQIDVGRRRLFHLIALAVALLPFVWFLFCRANGVVEWYFTIQHVRE